MLAVAARVRESLQTFLWNETILIRKKIRLKSEPKRAQTVFGLFGLNVFGPDRNPELRSFNTDRALVRLLAGMQSLVLGQMVLVFEALCADHAHVRPLVGVLVLVPLQRAEL